MSGLSKLFEHAGGAVPTALAEWEEQVTAWCDEYMDKFDGAELSEMNLGYAVFIFDHKWERGYWRMRCPSSN